MSIIALLLSLVIWGVVFYVAFWAAAKLGLPEPFAKVVNVLLVVAAVLVIFGLLFGTVEPFPFLVSVV
jgi:formate-dependent nitrite reductase membrane component NrfD